jgi:hypothetical protein
MEKPDNNGEPSDRSGWSWRPTAKTWVLVAGLTMTLVPFLLRACGVSPTKTELPAINVGFSSNSEARNAANAAKQLANLMNQMNANRQRSNAMVTKPSSSSTPPR